MNCKLGLLIVSLLLIILYLYYVHQQKPTEHVSLAAPDFKSSLVNKYRAEIQDEKGMSVTDYLLENQLLHDKQLSQDVKILGFN